MFAAELILTGAWQCCVLCEEGKEEICICDRARHQLNVD